MDKYKYLKKRIKSLKPEQKIAFDEMQINNLLQLCYPCGFGKGYIIGTDLLNQVVNTNNRIFALCSHRLGLNEQHISDIFDIFMNINSPLLGEVAFAFIGSSGGLSKKELSANHEMKLYKRIADYNAQTTGKKIDLIDIILTTTSKKELQNFINNNHNRKIIIVSTYHSSDKLHGIDIGTIYADEAHELASNHNDYNKKDKNGRESFIKNYIKIVSGRNFCFTATPKDCSGDSNETFLMNNFELFGKRIGMTHKESIESGYILGTSIYLAHPSGFDPTFNNDFGSIINKANFVVDIFKFHKKWLLETSSFPEEISPKLLVRCSSVEKDLWPIFTHLREMCGENIKIFACASKSSDKTTSFSNVIYQNNKMIEYDKKRKDFKETKNSMSRKKFIEALQSLDNMDEAIVLHHDTISEGINVPGFTCFVPFSDNLIDFIKLYQNIGRIIRLNIIDKNNKLINIIDQNIEENTLNTFGWIKPKAQVIIPYWSNVSFSAEEIMADTIDKLEQAGVLSSVEIPNCSHLTTGFGGEKEKSTQKKTDNSQKTVEEILIEKYDSRRRNVLNRKVNDLESIEEVMEHFNSLIDG